MDYYGYDDDSGMAYYDYTDGWGFRRRFFFPLFFFLFFRRFFW